MSHHTWNFSHQKQEEQVVEKEVEENRYPRSHVHNQQNQVDPMSNKCEVAELTWENGQVAMHRLGSNLSNEQTKHTWGKAGDTLESIVHQATFQKQNHSYIMGSDGQNQANINRDKNVSYGAQQTRGVLKRMRSSDSDPQLYIGGISLEHLNARASARDNDITMVTWPCNEDSACHGGSENKEELERETKSSNPSKRSRRAAVHNQSERRRRVRINEKMKALQKLVPNASKQTDKASMLEEVIKYLKQLQAQIHMISYAKNMEQQMLMMMQPHIQMPLLARMSGLSLGMGTAGMINNMSANLARAPYQSPLIYPTSIATPSCHPFMSPAFGMAPTVHTQPSQVANYGDAASATVTKAAATAPNIATTSLYPFNDPYNAFLAQSMKMELNNEMVAQYMQQVNQSMQSKFNQENVNIQGQKE
ncbi:hypothetical protein MTR67_028701 [Solanum verrucosum]|uniref:BHLH domain-containing protein n=1 Tax=Solanum verrucosum TaxID=315347 RepID=A0AAF0TWL3_SOLVR|nr:hypothetical protein MTR67_028701 [Solanum verrucosum]